MQQLYNQATSPTSLHRKTADQEKSDDHAPALVPSSVLSIFLGREEEDSCRLAGSSSRSEVKPGSGLKSHPKNCAGLVCNIGVSQYNYIAYFMKKTISKPSIRQRIKEEVVRMIGNEMMLPGDKIESQNELAKQFATTPVTIHKALTELAREGVIERRKGVGTFVADKARKPLTNEKRVCLVLHRSGLDRPEVNPEYWPYMQDVIFEFTHALSDAYSFSMKFAGPDSDISRLISELQGCHSVFFHYSNEVPNDVLKAILRSRVAPVIKIGKMQENLDCLLLENDRFEGIRLGTEHLVGLGHRKIGYVGSTKWWGDIGLAGFRSALSAVGLDGADSHIVRVEGERKGGIEAADSFVAIRDLPEAVMVDSDLRALGLVEQLRNKGVRIPEDISIMSYDGLHFATYHPPYLSSVRIPYGEMIKAGIAEVEAGNASILAHKVITFVGSVVSGATTAPRSGTPKAHKTAGRR